MGKRIEKSKNKRPVSVQPHACGEKPSDIGVSRVFRGSTPRMWGKGKRRPYSEVSFRFNPTHVGKSHRLGRTSNVKTVQPHACGEKRKYAFNILVKSVQPHACGEKILRNQNRRAFNGSTPRMWGKVDVYWSDIQKKRFNPTHVGKRYDRPLQL